jgi:hypothetical protein
VRRPSVSLRVRPTRNHPCARQGCNVARAVGPVALVLVAPAGSCLVVPVLGTPAALAPVVLMGPVGSCLMVPVLGGPVGPMGSDRVGPSTIGDPLGIRRTTIGAGGSMAPRGGMACRRGVLERRPVPRGTGSCRHRGDLRHRRSTTSATHSNRSGIPATTNGASGSSGYGFRCPSDEQGR